MQDNILTGRAATENMPEQLERRLIATAEKEMVGKSAIIRKCLNEGLMPWNEEADFFYKQALQK